MGKNLDHDDLGIDLDRVASLPTCDACRKKTDGARRYDWEGVITTLCGTHGDEFIRRRFHGDNDLTPQSFAKELREGRYKACWEAKIDE